MDELARIISGQPSDTTQHSQAAPAPQQTSQPSTEPAAALLGSLANLDVGSSAVGQPAASPGGAHSGKPPPPGHYQAWDDLFADAGAVSHGHDATAGAAAGGNTPQADVDRWFAEADADHDDRVAGGEAIQFFTRTGLPKGDLSRVWRAAKRAAPAEGDGLTKQQFAAALRVVAYAQSGGPLEDEAAVRTAAAEGEWQRSRGQLLPPPRIAPLGAPAGSSAAASSVSAAASPEATLHALPAVRPGANSPVSSGAVAAAASPAQNPAARLQQRSTGAAVSQLASNPAAAAAGGAAASPAAPGGSSLKMPLDAATKPAAASPSSSVSQLHSGSELEDSSDDEGLGAIDAVSRPPLAHARTIGIPRPQRLKAASTLGAQSMSERAMRRPSPNHVPQQNPSFKDLEVGAVLLDPAPLAIDVRQPPLHPKRSAALRLLAAANGSLFAAPAAPPVAGQAAGGFVQWAGTRGSLGLPQSSSRQDDIPDRIATEDCDAAPGWEVPLRDVKSVTSMHVDMYNDLLWTGHHDGWVCGYAVGDSPGAAVERRYCFAAFRGGSVTAICATAWGDLWVANSRGGIRVWPSAHEGPAMGEVEPRELRRGASGNRPHGGPISALALPLSGQVMWSCSGKTICLWSADTGAWLGKIGGDRELEEALGDGSSFGGSHSDALSSFSGEHGSHLQINSAKGLDLDAAGGVASPSGRLSRDEEVRRQRAWAEQTDTRLAGVAEQMTIARDNVGHAAVKAGKFFKKLHNRLASKVEGESSVPVPSYYSVDRPQAAEAPAGSSLQGSQQGDLEAEQHQGHGDLKALVAGPDGYVWAGHKRGLLERYTAGGCLQWFKEMGTGIRCAAAVNDRLWLGLASGALRVFSAGPKPGLLAHWFAHESAVVAISQAGRRVFTLGADGSIRGWSADIPSSADDPCRQELEAQMGQLVSRRSYTCAAMTWNVNEQRPEASAAFAALRDAAADAHLVAIGLQEIEMGGGSVAIAAAKDAIARSMLEKGNANAHWWGKRCLAALDSSRGGPWEKIGLRQLSGMLVLVFARQVLREVVGEVATASVATGVLGVGGNKGAVALGFTLHRRRVAILASHFAAHQGAVEARNANYAQITTHLAFKRGAHIDDEASGNAGAREVKHVGSASRIELAEAEGQEAPLPVQDELEVQGEGVGSAELLVWMGDFNYRIVGERDAVVSSIRKFLLRGDTAALQQLLAKDQLRRELAAGRVFRFMHEAPITFAPTYKFDKGDAAPLAYDSSEKQRVPAWCDRILFRGSELTRTSAQDAQHNQEPDEPEAALEAEEIRVGCSGYISVPAAVESDHKPVLARLAISMPVTDQAKKRSRASAILAAADARAAEVAGAPAVALHPASVTLENGSPPAELLQLVNRGNAAAVFSLAPAPTGGVTRDGLPSWLMAHPARGLLQPGERCAICLGAHPSQRSRPLQAKLVVRVLSLPALGGVKEGQQLLRLSVTCTPSDARGPALACLRQDAVSVRHF